MNKLQIASDVISLFLLINHPKTFMKKKPGKNRLIKFGTLLINTFKSINYPFFHFLFLGDVLFGFFPQLGRELLPLSEEEVLVKIDLIDFEFF